jgi:hypothetical protein
LAYDSQTGAPLNWKRLLPKSLAGKAELDALYTKIKPSQGDSGAEAYLESMQGLPVEYVLWPDAKHDGIALQPYDLPFVNSACADTVCHAATDGATTAALASWPRLAILHGGHEYS